MPSTCVSSIILSEGCFLWSVPLIFTRVSMHCSSFSSAIPSLGLRSLTPDSSNLLCHSQWFRCYICVCSFIYVVFNYSYVKMIPVQMTSPLTPRAFFIGLWQEANTLQQSYVATNILITTRQGNVVRQTCHQNGDRQIPPNACRYVRYFKLKKLATTYTFVQ